MEATLEQHRRNRNKATQTATRQRNGAPQLRRYPMTMRSQGTATRSWMARLFLAILVAKSSKLMDTKRDVIFTKKSELPDPHISDMSSGEDVDVRGSVWLVRVASSSSCIGFTRCQ